MEHLKHFIVIKLGLCLQVLVVLNDKVEVPGAMVGHAETRRCVLDHLLARDDSARILSASEVAKGRATARGTTARGAATRGASS